MFLINQHIDPIIIRYLFKSNSDKRNSSLLNKIYKTFGSGYQNFLITCRDYFFHLLFYKHQAIDIYNLLQRLTRKTNINNFQCYQKFYQKVINLTIDCNQIDFQQLKAKHRLIVYYLSLFHGYYYYSDNIQQWEEMGYNYYHIWNDYDKPFSYSFLKRKRIHNLDYYDCIEKGKTIWDSKFVPKSDAKIYKKGVTKELKDIHCIKVITF